MAVLVECNYLMCQWRWREKKLKGTQWLFILNINHFGRASLIHYRNLHWMEYCAQGERRERIEKRQERKCWGNTIRNVTKYVWRQEAKRSQEGGREGSRAEPGETQKNAKERERPNGNVTRSKAFYCIETMENPIVIEDTCLRLQVRQGGGVGGGWGVRAQCDLHLHCAGAEGYNLIYNRLAIDYG